VLTINPAIPNNILVLEHRGTFLGYQRDFGDAIVRHYEDNGVVLVPHLPIAFDLELFAGTTWPAEFKKVGSFNGLDQPVLLRSGASVKTKANHPLVLLYGNDVAKAAYVQSQIAAFNAQLTAGLQHLFPTYRFPPFISISWRLTPTENEGVHLDVFRRGQSGPEASRRLHRLKVFVNLDSEPRVWRVATDLAGALIHLSDRLPRRLPADVNVLNDILCRTGLLASLPSHEIRFPQMSAVLANGETVVHQVIHGRRMVAFECACDATDMRDSGKLSHSKVADWIRAAGLIVADDPEPKAENYVSGPSVLCMNARGPLDRARRWRGGL
jgi:hypothetical protein